VGVGSINNQKRRKGGFCCQTFGPLNDGERIGDVSHSLLLSLSGSCFAGREQQLQNFAAILCFLSIRTDEDEIRYLYSNTHTSCRQPQPAN